MNRSLVVLGAAVLVSACTHLPPVSDGLGFSERQARLAAIDTWEMRGRLAIDTGERAFQARFSWYQDADAIALNVRGLLGAGSFEIAGPPRALTVRSRGESRLLTDPEFELSQMFGWWLPVTSLSAWLVGLPDPLYPAVPVIASEGTLTRLEQRLWNIDVDEYQLSAGVLVPRRMTLTHDTLELVLTVDGWEPVSPAEDALN